MPKASLAIVSRNPAPVAVREETLLARHLRAIRKSHAGYFSVHLHLSDLQAANRKPHFIRVAVNAFDPLLKYPDAALFVLYNSDIVLVCRDVSVGEIDLAIAKVRALFNEDPLTAGEEGTFEDRLTTWYDLSESEDAATLDSVVEELAADAVKNAKGRGGLSHLNGAKGMGGRPLAPANLAAINQQLQGTPIADLIHRQTAVRIRPGGIGDILFREHYVSMTDLQQRIAPGVNLFGSTWLFQYLTETLDRRLLAIVARRDFTRDAATVSLNLNISTVLSNGFQTFHRKVGNHADKLIIEFQVIDVFADMGAYAYARDSLQERGYRVLIDGLNPLALQFFDPGILGADMVKINWGVEFRGSLPNGRVADLRDVIRNAGKDRIILARVDSEEAIKWGAGIGIDRFQGRFIDPLAQTIAAKGLTGII